MGALEQRIQNSILRYLRRLPETWAFKADVSTRGIPDIICVHRGRFIAFEVKRPGEKPSAIQIANMQLARTAGAEAYAVESLAEVKEILAAPPAARPVI